MLTYTSLFFSEPSSLEEDDPVPQSLLLQISETGTDANQTGRDSPSDPEKEGQLTEKVPVCHMVMYDHYYDDYDDVCL